MGRHSNHSKEFKIKVCKDYLDGKISSINITDESETFYLSNSMVLRWVKYYQKFGEDYFDKQSKNKSYSKALKNQVVQDYLLGIGSLVDLSIKYHISSISTILKWVLAYTEGKEIKDYNLNPEVYTMARKKTTYQERIEIVNHCLDNQLNTKETAALYGVSYAQVNSWVNRFLKDGEDALQDRRGKRKSEESLTLQEKQERRIKQLERRALELERENELLKKARALEAQLWSSQGTKK